ncbi:MAG: ice-binding family protein [Bacteroidota bacterium]
MKNKLLLILAVLLLLCFPKINFGQAPDLGTSSGFALFTSAGAFDNVGASNITGDIGTDVGALSGFPPGTISGQIHVVDATSAQAATDVDAAYYYLSGMTCGAVLGIVLGGGQVLTPNVYCLGGASTLNGDLTLDAQGDPDALFIFQINGAFSTGISTNIILLNSASVDNVYWQINGAFDLGDNSIFEGTIVANGAITLLEASSLFGRGLSRAGAIYLNNNVVSKPIIIVPVTLVSFNAEKCETQTCVDLSWQTASEFNSDYFLIERAADGINFKTIGKSDGAGYSSQLLSYFFTDESPEEGINYYRLNQFDIDGKNEYFPVKAVNFSNTILAVSIYPNPFSTLVNISMREASQINNYELRMYNIFGEEVMNAIISNQVTTLETSSLPSGNYFYKVIGNDKTTPMAIGTGKLISQK